MSLFANFGQDSLCTRRLLVAFINRFEWSGASASRARVYLLQLSQTKQLRDNKENEVTWVTLYSNKSTLKIHVANYLRFQHKFMTNRSI